jgi:formylglycine-generating enzyme required for sulfatase activity
MQNLLAALLMTFSSAVSIAAEQEPARPPLNDEITRNMVLVPAGKFQRGCDSLGPEHGAPAHPVYLDAYMMDIYEVTNERLEKVMPDHSSSCDNCPVTKITWYEAADYCHLIGKALPSEAQWEKAAGAANGCEFPWGPDFDPKKNQARGGLELKDKVSPVGWAVILPINLEFTIWEEMSGNGLQTGTHHSIISRSPCITPEALPVA